MKLHSNHTPLIDAALSAFFVAVSLLAFVGIVTIALLALTLTR